MFGYIAIKRIVLLNILSTLVGCNWAASDTLSVSGPITKSAVTEIKRSATPNIKNIEITSSGGNIVASIELAEWIQSRSFSVTARSYCLSACASIILPAGAKRFIRPNTFIGFHGSLFGRFKYYKDFYSKDELASARAVAERLSSIYLKSGIDPKVMIDFEARLLPYCVETNAVLSKDKYEPVVMTRLKFFLAGPNYLKVIKFVEPNIEIRPNTNVDEVAKLSEVKASGGRTGVFYYDGVELYNEKSNPIVGACNAISEN